MAEVANMGAGKAGIKSGALSAKKGVAAVAPAVSAVSTPFLRKHPLHLVAPCLTDQSSYWSYP